jgi:hypothetical protein
MKALRLKLTKQNVAPTYEAINENPRVFVAYGETPAQVLINMSSIFDKNNIDWWSSATVQVSQFDDDDYKFYMVVYV